MVLALDCVKVSVWVAVATSKFNSRVMVGMAATKLAVMFSFVNLGVALLAFHGNGRLPAVARE
jgi:hypothetical protein